VSTFSRIALPLFAMLLRVFCCVILCYHQGSQDRVGLLQQKRMEKLEAERVSMLHVLITGSTDRLGSRYWQQQQQRCVC
jgi:hypothetical protein